MKTIRLNAHVYEMLIYLSKTNKPKLKPEAMVEQMIKTAFNEGK